MSGGTGRWKPYPAYKDSGVEWLGQVPEGWEVKRLRFLASINPTKLRNNLKEDSLVSFVPMENVDEYGGIHCQDRYLDGIGNGYTHFVNDDILIAKITPCFENGKGALAVNLTNGVGFGSTEFHVVRSFATMCPTYFFWVSTSFLFRKTGEAYMYGAGGQKRIPDSFIKNFKLPTPPLAEQRAIAAFLDQQCSQIDSLITNKRRMLDLLDEKRRAIITQAVTRGLDPSVPMKDSGVAWLGLVPAGWTTQKLATVARLQGGFAFNSNEFRSEGLPVIRMNNLRRGLLDLSEAVFIDPTDSIHSVALHKGDILYGMSGSIGNSGSLGNFAIVSETDLPAQLNQRVGRFICNKSKIDPCYLVFFIQSLFFYRQILLYITGTAQFNVSSKQVESCMVVLPPPTEQRAIADYLDAQTTALDAQKKNLEKSIDLLREYRASLITHAVTGKIDVRDFVPAR